MSKYLLVHPINSFKEDIKSVLNSAGQVPSFEEEIPNIIKQFDADELTSSNLQRAIHLVLTYMTINRTGALAIDIEEQNEEMDPKNVFKKNLERFGVTFEQFLVLKREYEDELSNHDRQDLVKEETK